MSDIRIDKRLLSFMYLLAFILLREWLLPVMEITETGHLALFLIFVGLAFILVLAGAKWWISFPLKVIYIFCVVHYIFHGIFLFSKETIALLISNLYSNFAIMTSGDWQGITNPFRTVLFYILIWMATYLISYWIESRKNTFVFYASTVVFIALIDTFSSYSSDGSILRVMIAGLLLIGLLSVSRLAARHDTSISPRVFVTISVPLIFVIVISGTLVAILPKQDPMWSDPVPYLRSMIDGTGDGGEGVSKSGYDPDDSQLGGSFEEDDSLVFEAMVVKKQYWKVETKNMYTSKGWLQSSLDDTFTVYHPGMELEEFKSVAGIESGNTELAELEITERFPFIVYPYGMTKVFTDADILFLNEAETGKYHTKNDEGEVSLSSYEIEFAAQGYSLKALRETTMDSLQSSEEDFTKYLQLPDELPGRVGELAQSVTSSSDNVYDKAKAIERYFGKNGFVYDRKDVAIPEGEEDYVDQFLFDTKRGYCDNYSTSMVVMLRTIGIPARWVKGFAPGEPGRNEEGENSYRITNNEAHSWVEAYMPGVGWMPFEPTIGFTGTTSIEYDIELDIDDPEVPEMPEQERERHEQEKSKEAAKVKKEFEFDKILGSIGPWIKAKIWWVLGVAVVLLSMGWWLFACRRKWIPKVIVWNYRSGVENRDKYEKRFKSLLTQLDRFGLKRKSGETLSTYAMQVDKYFGGDVMQKLTEVYEKGIYGKDNSEHDWHRLQELWEDLINRTSN